METYIIQILDEPHDVSFLKLRNAVLVSFFVEDAGEPIRKLGRRFAEAVKLLQNSD